MPDRQVTYVVTDLASGDVAEEAQFETFSFTESLRRPGSWSASHNLDHPAAEALEPALVAVYVDVGGIPLFGGILWDDEDAIGEGEATSRFRGQGMLSAYRDGRRTVRSRDGMTYATGVNELEIAWSDVDAFHVVEDLVAHAATFAGDVAFEEVRLHGPGAAGIADVTRSRNLASYELKSIAETIEDLADQAPTFDFVTNYEWVDRGDGLPVPRPFLDLYYPRVGVDVSGGLVFEEGRNVTLIRRTRTGAKSANVVTATGAGTGDAQKRAEAIAGDRIYPAGEYPRLEAVTNYRDEELDEALAAHATTDLAALKNPVTVLELELVETEDLSLTSYQLGDTAAVHIERGRVSEHSIHRIIARTVTFDDNGAFKIAVTTAEEAATLGTA